MVLEVPSRSFVLPDSIDPVALVSFLAERLDVVADPLLTATVCVVDTADRRLRSAGAELVLEARSDMHRLVLRDHQARQLHADVEPAPRYMLADLPPGALRDHLAPMVGVRAMLPLAHVSVEARPLRVLDDEGKTVVRLKFTSGTAQPVADLARQVPALADDSGPSEAPLPGQLDLNGVLGYPKPFRQLEGLLRAEAGLSDATRTLADQAIRALGGHPAGIRTKVRVAVAPDERTDRAAVDVLVALARMVEANLPGTVDDIDTEFLHDLRVAVRRSRSVLRQLKRAFPTDELGPQRDALHHIQEVTGGTRDLDVQLLGWDQLVAGLPDQRSAALSPVRDLLVAHRVAAFTAMQGELHSDAFAGRWAAYRAFLDRVAGRAASRAEADAPDAARPIVDIAGHRIARVYDHMVSLGEQIGADSPADALHRLRKRGKELRYLLELFGDVWPRSTVRPMVAALKDLQDVLGTHHDREVQSNHLRLMAGEVAEAAGGPDALLALGALVDRLDADKRDAAVAFAPRFAAFASTEQRQVVTDTFGGRS